MTSASLIASGRVPRTAMIRYGFSNCTRLRREKSALLRRSELLPCRRSLALGSATQTVGYSNHLVTAVHGKVARVTRRLPLTSSGSSRVLRGNPVPDLPPESRLTIFSRLRRHSTEGSLLGSGGTYRRRGENAVCQDGRI